MKKILYITYDGLTDPLGQSQILAYLKRLSDAGNQIYIVSFEKKELFQKEENTIREVITRHGLHWTILWYTKKPPVLSTVLDINKGYRTCKALHQQHGFQIVHCRGYIAAIIGQKLQRNFGLKFIFDMRGWWADEKKESGFWDKKIYQPVYNYFKKLERQFFTRCDYTVSLTHKGKEEIIRQYGIAPEKIGVIPTCVDFEIFKPFNAATRQRIRKELGIRESEKVFIYSGSVGGNYDPVTLVAMFKTYRQIHPDSFLLILSKDKLDDRLKAFFESEKIDRMAVLNSPFTAVTNYLQASDIGFVYYKMSFSTIGRSPTKIGEYWASGIPVISFKGIGDLDVILQNYSGSGILLSGDKASWYNQFSQVTFASREELRVYAEDYFHIDKGVQFYEAVYDQLVPQKVVVEG
jgi:glycosyltransferase involved in cell wall biosynthesis